MSIELDSIQAAAFTAKSRAKLAKDGAALPDGSFPIRDARGLRSAVQAVDRAKDSGKARAHIVARARALKLEDRLPVGWLTASVSEEDSILYGLSAAGFDESKFKRRPKGERDGKESAEDGGKFAPKEGGGSSSSGGDDGDSDPHFDNTADEAASQIAEAVDDRLIEMFPDKEGDWTPGDIQDAHDSLIEDGTVSSIQEEVGAQAVDGGASSEEWQKFNDKADEILVQKYLPGLGAKAADNGEDDSDSIGDLSEESGGGGGLIDLDEAQLRDRLVETPDDDVQTRKAIKNIIDTRMAATLKEAGVKSGKGLVDLSDAQLDTLAGKLDKQKGADPQLIKLVDRVRRGRRGDLTASVEDELDSITAAAAGMVPVNPPAEWFEDPVLDGPTALEVTADGRVFGHLAAWGTCHIANPRGSGVCVEPPTSRTNYGHFHLGQVEAEDGRRVPVGQITMETGHAPVGVAARTASAHYDHTGTAAADVRAGEDQHGIWVAGALRPTLTATAARTLMGAKLSGDWRGVKGNLELVGILAVNVPGFPVPRARVLVADAAPVADEWPEVRETLLAAGIVDNTPDEKTAKRRTRILAKRALGGKEGLKTLLGEYGKR